jgi:hypothetical protein
MERNVVKDNNKKEASLPFSGLLTEKEIREGKVRFVADVQDTQSKVAAIKAKKQANQLSI